MTFIIKDSFSNVLQHNGKFNFSHYGNEMGVPMEFPDFEDAWGYLYEKFDHLSEKEFDDQMGEFYVEEKE